jgi:hypothetical protein
MTTMQAVGAASSGASEWLRDRVVNHSSQRAPTPSAYRAGDEGRHMGQGASLATISGEIGRGAAGLEFVCCRLSGFMRRPQ